MKLLRCIGGPADGKHLEADDEATRVGYRAGNCVAFYRLAVDNSQPVWVFIRMPEQGY